MLDQTANFVKVEVSQGYDDTATSIDLVSGDGAKMPDPASGEYNVVWWDSTTYPDPTDDPNVEIVRVTAISTDTLTVTRAQEGTSATTKNTSGSTYKMILPITSKMITDIQNALNKKIENIGGVYGINVESLAGDKTLVAGTDAIYQYLDTNGASRNITLDTDSAVAGDRFVIRNTGDNTVAYYLKVLQGTTTLDYIYVQAFGVFIFDGTNWVSNQASTGLYAIDYNVALGYNAKSLIRGTSLGYQSYGYCYGVAVGCGAQGYIYSVAVGNGAAAGYTGAAVGSGAQAAQCGAAVGFFSCGTYCGVGIGYYGCGGYCGVGIGFNANGFGAYRVALGYYSKALRYNELLHQIGDGSTQYYTWSVVGWKGSTADDTETELFLDGSAERLVLQASSGLVFSILVVGRDDTSNKVAAYKFEGVIKQDGSANTAMVGSVVKTEIAEDDANWDANVSADDTNEALVLKVIGDATDTTKWMARASIAEVKF